MKLQTPPHRNPAEFAVLAALEMQDSHGYRLVAFLQENLSGICWLGRSQIYALLSRLEHEGLTAHERVDQPNFPSRKVFRLTESGSRELYQWLTTPVLSLRDLRVEFMIKLFFARMKSKESEIALLTDQLRVSKSKLASLVEARSRAASVIEREAVDYRIFVANACCAWLENLINQPSSISARHSAMTNSTRK